MMVNEIKKLLFGEKGLAGEVIEILKTTGILKDPEMELKVQQAMRDYEIKKAEQEVKLEEIFMQDRQSARNREIEVVKSGRANWTQNILSYGAVAGFFAVLYMLFVMTMPEGFQRDALLILLGTLTKIVSDIYNYYFGSSAGSSQKTAVLAEMARGK